MIQLLLLLTFIFSHSARAESSGSFEPNSKKKQGSAFAFYIENDSSNVGGPGSDQGYTNGVKFSYIYAEDHVPKWSKNSLQDLRWLDHDLDKSKVNFEISLGQQIYTPNNIASPNLIPDDRPYAGWLYVGLATNLKEEFASHFFELDIGLVGPSALGKQIQNGYHKIVEKAPAQGWSHGLNDEPTLQLFYQKRFKYLNRQNFDLIPFYGAALGNVQIAVHVGGLARLGVNLPNDFGPSRPSASDGDSFVPTTPSQSDHQLGYYIFGSVRGNAIARNMFLDGNTFQSSHHVTKYPFNFDTEFGLGMQLFPVAVVWRYVVRSPEFKERSIFNGFGCLNITYFFN